MGEKFWHSPPVNTKREISVNQKSRARHSILSRDADLGSLAPSRSRRNIFSLHGLGRRTSQNSLYTKSIGFEEGFERGDVRNNASTIDGNQRMIADSIHHATIDAYCSGFGRTKIFEMTETRSTYKIPPTNEKTPHAAKREASYVDLLFLGCKQPAVGLHKTRGFALCAGRHEVLRRAKLRAAFYRWAMSSAGARPAPTTARG